MGERLIHCDVTALTNIPEYQSRPSELTGTPRQIAWADSLRDECRDRWKHDLPAPVFDALAAIDDSTWWIANKDAEASEIKWPESWTELRNRQPTARPAPPQGKTLCQVFEEEERAKATNGCSPKLIRDIQQFESFARKAALSPELSYLTIMALVYRQVKDPRVLALFRESRERIEGHLAAINQIIGE
jgi:hypothetical protein